MHSVFEDISHSLLLASTDALNLANTHATYFDPSKEHWATASVIEAARAGELLIKAVIAKSHPLLIFKNVFSLDSKEATEISLDDMIERAKTHDFQHLPQILWAVTKQRVSDKESYEAIRQMRNALQHFFHHETTSDFAINARNLTFEFVYRNLDPLLFKNFGQFAINFVDDDIGYDYLVAQLHRRGLKFSIPDSFDLTEVDPVEEI